MPTNSTFPTRNFTPAVLKHNARGWYVEYFVYNPATGTNQRFRENLNKLRKRMTLAEFKHYTSITLSDINAKLMAGWSPLASNMSTMQYVRLVDALHDYSQSRKNDLRKSTMVSYQSVIDILCRYLEEIHAGDCLSGSFTHQLAIRFMDYLQSPTDNHGNKKTALSANAWNTYLKKYLAVFGWLVERDYCQQNPFSEIKKRPKEEKRRTVVPEATQENVIRYLQENDMQGYLMVIHLIYNSLIRPKEIEMLRVRDVNLEEHYIYISASVSKTHKERYAVLTDQECEMLREWHLENYPGMYYLIGSGYQPAYAPTFHGKFKKDWIKIRNDLHLPQGVQLYSWKDTGISDMFSQHINPLSIMNAAGHQNIEVTMRYAHIAADAMIKEVREKARELPMA